MRSTDKVSVRSPKLSWRGSIPRVRAEEGEQIKGQIPLGYPLTVSPEEIGVKAQVDVLAVDAARPGFESQILHKIYCFTKIRNHE